MPHIEKIFSRKRLGGTPGAAYDAAVLIRLQDTSVDIADYYQGTTMWWGGLFDQFGVPRKPYYIFKAFKYLLDDPERVRVTPLKPAGVAAIAGLSRDKTQAAILITNFGTNVDDYKIIVRKLPWKRSTYLEKYVLDNNHNLDITERTILNRRVGKFSVKAKVPSVCLIRLIRSSTSAERVFH
jgi:hypothetical protein